VDHSTVRIFTSQRTMFFALEQDFVRIAGIRYDLIEIKKKGVKLMPEGEGLLEIRSHLLRVVNARPTVRPLDDYSLIPVANVTDGCRIF
jgi:hypothetical protein